MEIAYNILAISLLLATIAIGWALTLVAMPGTWLMVGGATLYAWLGPQAGVIQLHWQSVIAMLVVATVGEVAESLAGVVGAHRAGGSRRSAVYSLIGSIIGAIGGATIGIPIPLIGSAIGAVLGGAVGAFAGAAYAEHTLGETANQSMKVAQAAFWGRLLGTGAKTLAGSVIAAIVLVAICT